MCPQAIGGVKKVGKEAANVPGLTVAGGVLDARAACVTQVTPAGVPPLGLPLSTTA